MNLLQKIDADVSLTAGVTRQEFSLLFLDWGIGQLESMYIQHAAKLFFFPPDGAEARRKAAEKKDERKWNVRDWGVPMEQWTFLSDWGMGTQLKDTPLLVRLLHRNLVGFQEEVKTLNASCLVSQLQSFFCMCMTEATTHEQRCHLTPTRPDTHDRNQLHNVPFIVHQPKPVRCFRAWYPSSSSHPTPQKCLYYLLDQMKYNWLPDWPAK